LVSVFLSLPLHAKTLSSGAVRLALIENVSYHFDDWELATPLMRVLRQYPSSGTLRDIEMLDGYYSGSDYRFRIPHGLPGASGQTPALVLETESSVAIFTPSNPSLISALLQAAQDPSTYQGSWSVLPATRTVMLSVVQQPSGDSLVTALLDPSRGEEARWSNAIAGLVHLRWEDQNLSMVLIGKQSGGLGRLATALKRTKNDSPPIIGLSRGDVFGDPLAEFQGSALIEALEKLGLSYSAVASADIFHWKDLEGYRRRHPNGIHFLSANLVVSSAPAVNLLPDHALLEAGGLQVAITAVTPPSASKYLSQAGLKNMSIIDPIQALASRISKFRAQADVVVLLVPLNKDMEPLRKAAHGVDLIMAESEGPLPGAHPFETQANQAGRRKYESPLWIMRAHPQALNLAEVTMTPHGDRSDMRVRGSPILLDDSMPGSDAFPGFDPESYGINYSTEPVLIPAASQILPSEIRATQNIQEKDFWTMAAGLLAEETHSEAGLLRAWPLGVQTGAAVKRRLLNVWLRYDDQPVIVWLKGSQLKSLIEDSQKLLAAQDATGPDKVPFAVGGLGPSGTTTVHGLPLDPNELYRVATSKIVADLLDLPGEHNPAPGGRSIGEIVMAALISRHDTPPARYWDWMQGQPIAKTGLWRVNFRDVSLNLQGTQVARANDFNSVPNPRIQGSNELLIGGNLKTDADYLLQDYKWGNTLELDYARSSLRPRDQPPITNVTSNRMSLTTSGTRRIGAVLQPWLAHSWGPSLALNYEGQLEATPPLRRRNIYSAYPGVEFYDGTFVRSLRLAANIKRDYSIDPVNTQYGLRARALFARDFGPAPVKFEGEAWANYFFLTNHDQSQDLRWESDVNFKLRIPIHKRLTIAPFLDFYSFALKTRPLWGYSAMTGVSFGFSRVWKPQYERF